MDVRGEAHVDHARSIAILIGVADANDGAEGDLRAVPAPLNSLRAMNRLLTDPDLGGWPTDRVTVLRNPDNPAATTRRLRELTRAARDLLVIYYVGRARLTSRGQLCLTLASADRDAGDNATMGYEWIARAVRDSPARRKVTILDCCVAGGDALGRSADSLADLAHVDGVYTLTATARSYPVQPTAILHGRPPATSFTGQLVELVEAGLVGGPAGLTLADLQPRLQERLVGMGLSPPAQRGGDVVLTLPAFARNVAHRPVPVPAPAPPAATASPSSPSGVAEAGASSTPPPPPSPPLPERQGVMAPLLAGLGTLGAEATKAAMPRSAQQEALARADAAPTPTPPPVDIGEAPPPPPPVAPPPPPAPASRGAPDLVGAAALATVTSTKASSSAKASAGGGGSGGGRSSAGRTSGRDGKSRGTDKSGAGAGSNGSGAANGKSKGRGKDRVGRNGQPKGGGEAEPTPTVEAKTASAPASKPMPTPAPAPAPAPAKTDLKAKLKAKGPTKDAGKAMPPLAGPPLPPPPPPVDKAKPAPAAAGPLKTPAPSPSPVPDAKPKNGKPAATPKAKAKPGPGPAAVEAAEPTRNRRSRRKVLVPAVIFSAAVLVPTIYFLAAPKGDTSAADQAQGEVFDLQDLGTRTVNLGAGIEPWSLTADGDTLWVQSGQGLEAELHQVDVTSGEVVATVPLPDAGVVGAVVSGDGSLWVSTASTETLSGSVVRIDPSDGEVLATIHLPVWPGRMVFAHGSLWVATVHQPVVEELGAREDFMTSAANGIDRIDPRTNEVAATIPLENKPVDVQASGDHILVSTEGPDGSALAVVDPLSETEVARLPVPDSIATDADPQAPGPWMLFASDPYAVRFDLEAEDVAVVAGTGDGIDMVVPNGEHLWEIRGKEVTVLGPQGDPIASITVDGTPIAASAAGEGAAWIAYSPSGSSNVYVTRVSAATLVDRSGPLASP